MPGAFHIDFAGDISKLKTKIKFTSPGTITLNFNSFTILIFTKSFQIFVYHHCGIMDQQQIDIRHTK